MLNVENLKVSYGSALALNGISFSVEAGNIITLLGANGAGKTTTVNTIAGLLVPTNGSIQFLGRRINGLPAEKIVRLGVTLIPEGRQLFHDMTVKENLAMGGITRKEMKGIHEDLNWVFSLFPILKERLHQQAGTLSGGEQQMLAIGRGLMSRPKLLLLDEPSLGLAPFLVKEIFEVIQTIHTRGVSILLVEQNVMMALKVAQYAYILELGAISFSGPSAQVKEDPQVKKSYLSYEV